MVQRIAALIPQGKWFDAVYAEALQPAAGELNIAITRVSSEFSSPGQLGYACAQINDADLVIADLTGRNPNIFYQAGYAHGVGKQVLLITQHGEDFPFDKDRHRTIIYSGQTAFLRAELLAFLRGEPSAPSPETAGTTAGIDDSRAAFMETFGDLLAAHGYEHTGAVEKENASTYILRDQDMDLPLVQDLSRRARELGIRLKLM